MAAEVLVVPPQPPRTTMSSRATASAVTDDLYRMFLSNKQTERSDETPAAPTTAHVQPRVTTLPQPAPTGCSGNGVTRTVIVIAGIDGNPARFRAAMEQTRYASAIAKHNGNRLEYAFLGGALSPSFGEEVLAQLVTLRKSGSVELGVNPEDVHLVIGPREMQALSIVADRAEDSGGELHEYLKHSVFFECIGPASMPDSGQRGIWLKTTPFGDVVGKLPGVGVHGADGASRAEWIACPTPLSPVAWKDEVNRRWRKATADPWRCKQEDPSTHRWSFWQSVASGCQREHAHGLQMPTKNLDLAGNDAIAVFACQPAPFGTTRRSLRVDAENNLLLAADLWLDLGSASDSLYWAVASYCSSTKQALAAAHKPPTPDRSMDAAELQFDVSATLSSLVQHEQRVDALTPPTQPYACVERLVGQLGPVVLGGRDNDEAMRVVQFSTAGVEDVLMLLSEAYLQLALKTHLQHTFGTYMRGARGVAGYLVLRDQYAIALKVPDLSASEREDAATQLGTRLWRLPVHLYEADEVADAIAKAPTVPPGSPIPSPPGTTIFYTATDTMDPLTGLAVKWRFAPGGSGRDMPTLHVVES